MSLLHLLLDLRSLDEEDRVKRRREKARKDREDRIEKRQRDEKLKQEEEEKRKREEDLRINTVVQEEVIVDGGDDAPADGRSRGSSYKHPN